MRILLLTHAFNGLTQRLFCVLREAGHTVSVEFDIADAVTEEAVLLFRPDVVIAPFLKRRIPESVWRTVVCLVLHPGPPGDRGPSALDHALLQGRGAWGVTVLQAQEHFDAGPVWAWRAVVIPPGSTKAGVYRREITEAAVHAVFEALQSFEPARRTPRHWPALPPHTDRWQPLVTGDARSIDWAAHDTAEVLRRIRSADGAPGARALLCGRSCRLFDAHEASAETLRRAPAGAAGMAVARRGPALLVRSRDAAVWIGHVRLDQPTEAPGPLKLPATLALAHEAATLPTLDVPLMRPDDEWDELRYDEFGGEGQRVGWLAFEFHNGALSERQAARLQQALQFAQRRPTRVLVLAGGREFFSNGIHLHEIEAAAQRSGDSAADASWRHINAIDDVALAILMLTDRLTVAAMQGNAGAGGCFLALAADLVWAHEAVLLNPHYKNMGNLHGSEYWTHLLPLRVGEAGARQLMQGRLPISATQAAAMGLIDGCLAPDAQVFAAQVLQRALALAAAPDWADQVAAKAQRRQLQEARRPLAEHRAAELARMHRNFYGFDPSYHVARHHFVHRKPHAWTPRHLAIHR
ncbi:MAG: hydrogenase maturation protein [Ideonella sp.]|nr:hydrogenase maturation protein [Ideonella sp.]MBL0148182.1 hydrogenase maturation protein [Ideonella sp.]